jgi:hypothetical protein
VKEGGETLGIHGLSDSLATSTLRGLDHDRKSDSLSSLQGSLGIVHTGLLVNIIWHMDYLSLFGVALNRQTFKKKKKKKDIYSLFLFSMRIYLFF